MFDKSNIHLRDNNKVFYYKKTHAENLNYIDYGVSYLNKKLFVDRKKNENFDLSELFEQISRHNLLSGHKVKKRFYEIGSYNGIKDFKKYIKNEIY